METPFPGAVASDISVAPAKVRQGAIKDGRTETMGGHFDPEVVDAAAEGSVLIGLAKYGLATFVNFDVVHAIRPIYRTAAGKEVMGQQHGADTSRVVVVKAKPGYAVGAVTATSALTVTGLSVTFMKLGGTTLNPDDSYNSPWIGSKGHGREKLLTGNGVPIVGILCKENAKDVPAWGCLPAGTVAPAGPICRRPCGRLPACRTAQGRPLHCPANRRFILRGEKSSHGILAQERQIHHHHAGGDQEGRGHEDP